MIRCENLQVTFNKGTAMETRALRGLSLDVPAGEFVTLIGSNGSGKSTFLNILAGDLTPEAGSIVIDGEDVTDWPAPKRARLVSRVFQDPLAGSCGNLTIEENLALAGARVRGRRGLGLAVSRKLRDDFRGRIERLGMNLENRLGDRMGLLSGGQRQAVSLLMATLAPSKLLLLDEHTSALDPRIAAAVIGLTLDIVGEQKLTTLMVTHSMRQALDAGTRTVMLHAGQAVLDIAGERRDGLDVPDLIRLFQQVHGEELDSDSLLLG
ncbi:ABC transporter ATP-binding protein [Oceanibacterium hippocampi]|uniref:Thiamine import ATP-binding protein ThiQ n=1 Tax=Oceanibacterium hippocampi TaxID=745714 RepID=A0A1Y5SHW7_9PROT|nr:ABC transporter ATP-binding protein [Oceanibacterium hippocampi]SLN40881.1 Thiamine import ATP-binding protein ThiQ [Oceanibacterium hippocampi]